MQAKVFSGWRVRRSVVVAVTALGLLAGGGPGYAVQIQADWNAGNGLWNDPLNWSFSALPTTRTFPNNDVANNEFFDVRIDSNGGTNSTATLNANVTIDSLRIDAGDTLNLTDGRTLTVVRDVGRATSGAIVNDGNMLIQTTGGFNTLSLTGGEVQLDGGGTITLDDSASTARARIRGGTGGALNNVDNLIQGSGELGEGSIGLTNGAAGIIDANIAGRELEIDASAAGFANAGLVRARNGGTLQLQSTVVNNAGGTIQAGANSEVDLASSTVAGGTLTGAGDFVVTSSATLDGIGMTLDGVTLTPNNGAITTLVGDIDLTNSTNINVFSTGSFTDLVMSGVVTLGGDGTGVISLSDSNNTGRARIRGVSDGVNDGHLILDDGNTVQGEGQLGSGSTEITVRNGSLVDANVNGKTLTVDPSGAGVNNSATMRASNGGTLELSSGTVDNTGGTLEAQSGSVLDLNGSVVVSGGTIEIASNAVLELNTATIQNGVTNIAANAEARVQVASRLSGTVNNAATGLIAVDNGVTLTLDGGGTYNNAGLIDIASTGGFTDLRIDGAANLEGGGTVRLGDSDGTGRARIRGINSAILTNTDNTIEGEGLLGNGSTEIRNLTNGVIDANVSGDELTLDTSAAGATNSGEMRSSNGGVLNINGATVDNTGGTIRATNGSTTELSGSVVVSNGNVVVESGGVLELNTATIQGGTTDIEAGGVVSVVSASTLSGLVNSASGANININNGVVLTLNGGGTYDNDGLIDIASTGGFTDLVVDGAANLVGGGTVRLGDSNGTGRARIRGTNGGVLTNNGNTIEGEGLFGNGSTEIRNLAGGTIDANVNGRELTLDSNANGVTNSGEMLSSNGGRLNITGATVNNAGGTIRASIGSTTELSGAVVVTGGNLLVENGGVFELNSAVVQGGTTEVQAGGDLNVVSSSTLSGTVNNAVGGDITVSNGFALTLNSGGTYNNAGDIKLASTGGFTDVVIDGNVELGGGGTLTLEDTNGSGRARVRGINSGVLTNDNHTIQGEGQLGTGSVEIRNLSGGLVDANVAGRTLTVNGNPGVTNAGTMRASNGGTLALTFETIENAGGVLESQAGSTVQFTGTTVNGGTLTGPGLFRIDSALTLDGIGTTIDGATITQSNGRALSLRGDFNVINGGHFDVNSTGGFTDVIIDGNVTLDGDGSGRLSLRDTDGTGRARIRGVNSGTLTNRNFTIEGEGLLGNGTTNVINATDGVVNANVNGEALTINPGLGGFANAGVLRASNGGLLIATSGDYSNTGTVEALDGSEVRFENFANVTSVDGSGTLNEGTWRSVDGGAGASVQLNSAVSSVSAIGANAAVELSGTNSAFTIAGVAIDDTLADNAGGLTLRNGRAMTTSGDLTNTGNITIDGAGTELRTTGNYIQTAGRTELNGGELISGNVLDFQGGTLAGSGTVRGAAIFGAGATIDAGFSPGIINFGDGSTFDGLINIELDGALVDGAVADIGEINAGTDPLSTGFDQLHVTGTANLLDSLTIDIALGFAPSANDFFDIITADVLNVDLNQLTLLMPSSFSASVVSLFDPTRGRNAQALRLTFNGQSTAPVPAPGTLALVVLALFALRRARRFG